MASEIDTALTLRLEASLAKFERQMAAVPDREAKVASVRNAAFACSLGAKNCSAGGAAGIPKDDDE